LTLEKKFVSPMKTTVETGKRWAAEVCSRRKNLEHSRPIKEATFEEVGFREPRHHKKGGIEIDLVRVRKGADFDRKGFLRDVQGVPCRKGRRRGAERTARWRGRERHITWMGENDSSR